MPTTIGNDYEYIDIATGGNSVRHLIKDSKAREDISDLQNAIGTVPSGETVEGQIAENAQDISDLKSAIDVLEPSATAEDVGKTLVAKTVTNGKVTEYEFGKAGEGLSEDAKVALLNCFAHTVFTDGDSNYYGILRNALYPDTYPKLTSLFNPGTHQVYQGDSLDSLKPYLTVKYYEDSSSSGTIIASNAYTLSGVLSAGNQIITVRYLEVSTTFTVSVNSLLYRLPNTPVVMTGQATDAVDTGVKLLETQRSFTIAFDAVSYRDFATYVTQDFIYYDVLPSGNYNGLFSQIYNAGYKENNTVDVRVVIQFKPGSKIVYDNIVSTSAATNQRVTAVLVYDKDTGLVRTYLAMNGTVIQPTSQTDTYNYEANSMPLAVGARYKTDGTKEGIFNGTFNDFRIYNYAISEAEALQFIEEMCV